MAPLSDNDIRVSFMVLRAKCDPSGLALLDALEGTLLEAIATLNRIHAASVRKGGKVTLEVVK